MDVAVEDTLDADPGQALVGIKFVPLPSRSQWLKAVTANELCRRFPGAVALAGLVSELVTTASVRPFFSHSFQNFWNGR